MKYLIFLVTASMLITVSAEGQILNRLKKKAKEAAEQKAEEKLTEQVQKMAEEMVEESWNSVFGEMSPGSIDGRLPFAQNSNVKTEDVYNFDTITTMQIETIKDGKPDPPVILDMHFNKNTMYTGTKFNSEDMKQEEGELFIIYDFKNSAMLMLMSSKDDKFSFAYDWKEALAKAEAMTEDESYEEPDWDEVEQWEGFTKIGSKNILGYNCDGYQSETDTESIELWVSRDAEFGMSNLFRANSNTKQIRGKIPNEYPEGMIMEMTSEDYRSGNKTIMKMKDIKKNAKVSYAMTDYPVMSFKPRVSN